MTRKVGGKIRHRYWTTACETCPPKHHCTPSKERRISRWEREDVLERVQQRLEDNPDKMATRRETAEHLFGTIKAWMGATHFKMRTLKRVATEMALHVLAYNMKRVIAIIGTPMLIKAITAFLSWFAAIIATEHAVRGPPTPPAKRSEPKNNKLLRVTAVLEQPTDRRIVLTRALHLADIRQALVTVTMYFASTSAVGSRPSMCSSNNRQFAQRHWRVVNGQSLKQATSERAMGLPSSLAM